MKRAFIILIVLTVSMFCLGCSLTEKQYNAEVPNPWNEWDSLEEAEKATGFKFGLPAVVANSYTVDSFRTLNDKLIEVVYHDDDYEITVRKQEGEGQDISDDYKEYLKHIKSKRNGAAIEIFSGLKDNATPFNPTKTLISYNGFSWSLVAPIGYWGDSHEDFLLEILNH